jgi:hypothetical protein
MTSVMQVSTPIGTLTLVMKVQYPSEKRDRQTDMDGPIRCSSLTLQCEEHLKSQNTIQVVATI